MAACSPMVLPTASRGDLLDEAARRLRRAGVEGPRLQAELLLGHVLGCDRLRLLTTDRQPVQAQAAANVESLVRRRVEGEPLQYLTGVQEFRSREFHVDPRVLIPRPETEDAVEACRELALGPSARIADVGTGSGCIAISLALETTGAQIVGLDLSAEALQVAEANARRLAPDAGIEWLQGDLLQPLDSARPPLDLIVSNPPYVTASEHRGLAPEVRDHEPREALVSGATGLEVIHRLVDAAPRYLVPGGALVLEIGLGQWSAVRQMIRSSLSYTEPAARPDFQGIPRIVTCRTRSPRP
ncbi:MAG: peptide chain release factor N(5)-glutamine methyltransferase [Acidobacteria bacterium]|nr:MAG: peptide chain release factor N(5)-glutamine methyltransferase [Acidobacteriota bacterium]